MLNSLEIKKALLELGFEQHIDDARILGFRHEKLAHPVYVKTPSGNTTADHVKKNPLVIHSGYENERTEIDALHGIYPNWGKIYKNSNLYCFEKFINTNSSKITFGVAANVESQASLESLFKALSTEEKEINPRLEKGLASLSHINEQFLVNLEFSKKSSSEERRKRLKTAHKKPEKIQVMATIYRRNPDVVIEVLERANGFCEMCKSKAPFTRSKDDTPYLEVHHIVQLAHDGDDSVENAIALCPNCHRYKHFGMKF